MSKNKAKNKRPNDPPFMTFTSPDADAPPEPNARLVNGKLDPLERAKRALDTMTDEEDAAITADALADPDNPPADELFARRGRPKSDNPKQPVSIRLDADVIEHFKAGGEGWQSRINAALRRAAKLPKAG